MGTRRRERRLFLAPLVTGIALLTVFPLLWSLALAVGRIDPADGGWSFAGLGQFATVLGDYRFRDALRFTVGFAALAAILETALGLGLALLVRAAGSMGELARTPLTLPLFMAPVALGYLGLTVFHEESGPLNLALAGIGAPGVPWLSSQGGAFLSLLLADLWEWTPFTFLIAYAGLLAQPVDLFEAARLEPLTAWGRFRHLTFPLLRPTLALAALLRFVEGLKLADLPFSLTGGGLGTETLSLLAYRKCMTFFDFGYGSALAWVLFALVAVLCQVLARWNLKRAAA